MSNQARFRENGGGNWMLFIFPMRSMFLARDRSRHQRCVLFIDHYVPHYDKDAGSCSTFMYVQLMLELGYRCCSWARIFPHKPYTQTLQQLGGSPGGEHGAQPGPLAARQRRVYRRDSPASPHVAEQFLPSLERLKPAQDRLFGHDLHHLRIGREYGVVR